MVDNDTMILWFIDYGIPLMLLLYLVLIVVSRLRKGSRPKHLILEGLALAVSFILFGGFGALICLLIMQQFPLFPIKPKNSTPQ